MVKFRNGSRARIGQHCGKNHFGFEFKKVEGDFNADRSRKNDLVRLIEVRDAIPSLLSELHQVQLSPALNSYDAYMEALRRDFQKLAQALERAERRNSILECTTYERDLEAEKRRLDTDSELEEIRKKIDRSQHANVRERWVNEQKRWMKRQPPIERPVVEHIGILAGGKILTRAPSATMNGLVRGALDLIQPPATLLIRRSSYEWSGIGLAKALDALRGGIAKLDEALGLMADLERFTASGNLAVIAKWTQREIALPQPSIDYLVRADGRTLIDEDDRYRLTLPTHWAIPLLPRLREFKRMLGMAAE